MFEEQSDFKQVYGWESEKYAGFLTLTEIIRTIGNSYSDGSLQWVTTAIANRAVSPMSIDLCVFSGSAKSFDLAIYKRKIITKCKSFG